MSRDWRSQAACLGMPTDLFFPSVGQRIPAAADAACRRCPVREDCLEFALQYGDRGFWAGMTRVERIAYRLNRRVVA